MIASDSQISVCPIGSQEISVSTDTRILIREMSDVD